MKWLIQKIYRPISIITRMDRDFMQDVKFDMEKYLVKHFARRFGKAEEAAFVSGTGVDMSTGILHETDGAEVGVNAKALTFDDVIAFGDFSYYWIINRMPISSPVISGTKIHELIQLLSDKQTKGVEVTIVTWNPDEYDFGDVAYWMQLHEEMRQAGFFIKSVEESCERFAIIDQNIVWYGNINILAKTKIEDSIMRVRSKEIVSELMDITFGKTKVK